MLTESFVSVVIPTRDRAEPLGSCLTGLAAQTFPRDRFEVLVVDDDSRVPPAGVIESVRPFLEVRFLHAAGRGPGPARNLGAAEARGSILAFTDDDCVPEPEWLEALTDRVAFDPPAAAGGQTINGLDGNVYAEASQILQDYVYSIFNADPERARFFATNNFAIPAAAFCGMGGFDETFGRVPSEDRDLCDRWLAAGRRLRYAPDAVVRHRHDMGWIGFLRQHWGYGKGAWRFQTVRGSRGTVPGRGPLAFYAGMVRHPFESDVPSPRRIAALVALSQVASAAGYVLLGAGERLTRPR